MVVLHIRNAPDSFHDGIQKLARPSKVLAHGRRDPASGGGHKVLKVAATAWRSWRASIVRPRRLHFPSIGLIRQHACARPASGAQNARRLMLDASVTVKAFVPEGHSTKARGLLAGFAQDDAEFVVPGSFPVSAPRASRNVCPFGRVRYTEETGNAWQSSAT